MELGAPYNTLELASFMSCSKGYMGECGLRGGYVELLNVCPEVRAVLHKAISAMLCPTVLGQTVMDCVVSFYNHFNIELNERKNADGPSFTTADLPDLKETFG